MLYEVITRSSIVNELARMEGRVTGMVPPCVEAALKEKFGYSD